MSERVDLVLSDARILLPGGDTLDGWIALQDEKVHSLGTGSTPAGRSHVDCGGRLILPGLVDIHVHFRDPGHTYKEDFLTGSAAAAFGGVTTVVDMPNTEGFVITPADLKRKIAAINGRSHVDYGFYALLTDHEHVAGLRELGVVGLKWLLGYCELDGVAVQPASKTALRDVLHAAASYDVMVGVHAESEPWLSELRTELEQAGYDEPDGHERSRPSFVEGLGVAEACILAADSGCRLHIHHLSSKHGLDVARAMRRALPLQLTIETCPQYLILTQDDVKAQGNRTKCNPPIRFHDDTAQLWAAIAAGEIDCVATDHAPHAIEEKETTDPWAAAHGLLGVETLLPLMLHEALIGRISMARLVELTAERPATIAGLDESKGSLLPGKDADLVVVDPNSTTAISAARLHSKQPLTVYEGLVRQGVIESVYLRGHPLVTDGALAAPTRGRFTPRRYEARREHQRHE